MFDNLVKINFRYEKFNITSVTMSQKVNNVPPRCVKSHLLSCLYVRYFSVNIYCHQS